MKILRWVAVVAFLAAGLTVGAQTDTPATRRIKEVIIKVEVTAKDAGVGITVNGNECTLGKLAETLRAAAKTDATPAQVVCEVQMPADMPYKELANVLISAAKANITTLHLTTNGKDFFRSTLPRLAKNADGTVGAQLHLELTMAEGKATAKLGDNAVAGAEDVTKQLKEMKGAKGLAVMMLPEGAIQAEVVLEYAKAVSAAGVPMTFEAPRDRVVTTRPQPTTKAGLVKRPMAIVYIVDHSAAVADALEGMKKEMVGSVGGMIPAMQFDVVMLGEKEEMVYTEMQKATPEVKKAFAAKVEAMKAQGNIAGKLEPFQQAFEKAFALGPDTIYFLAASSFDPKLVEVVAGLNKDKKVRVNAMAYGKGDATRDGLLAQIAKGNGGNFKFVSGKEAATRP